MALPQEFLMELKYKNDIESVLSPYIALKRRGSNLVGLCPFHNEKTPSFTVYPENGSYYCFGCGQGGDIITFTMKMENLDYIDAVRRLAERAGLKMPENDQSDKELKLRNDVYEVNREAAKFYHACLMSEAGKKGLDYFLSRGLSVATIKHFGLGFAPDDWHALENYLTKKGFSKYILQAADLIGKSQKTDNNGQNYTYDRFRNRVMFPLINIHGKVIGFGGRILPDGDKNTGKYVNTSDTPVFKKSNNVYAMNFAKNFCSERMILVEGNMDVIALHQAGFKNTVAALGTSFTEEQAKLIGRYTKEVIVTLDADSAGEKATDRAMGILENAGVCARILRLPECKDPDEFIKKNGAARFEALLDGAVSDIEYRLFTAARGVDLDASDGKLQYLKKCCEVLADLDDQIAVDLYAGRLASKYGVAKDVLLSNTRELVNKRKKQKTKKELDALITDAVRSSVKSGGQNVRLRAARAEESVIKVLLWHPDMLDFVDSNLTEDDFATQFGRKLFLKVREVISEGREFDLVLLGPDFSPDEVGNVTVFLSSGRNIRDPKKELADSIRVLKEEKVKNDGDLDSMSDDEWAEMMKKMSAGKQSGANR